MTGRQKQVLTRILLSAVLLVLASLLPLGGIWRLIAFLVPYGVIGFDVLIQAGRTVFQGQIFDENFLMAIATVGAFCIGEYPEGVAVMLFYQIGELFQGLAVGKSRRSIAELMNLRPETATVLKNGAEQEIAVEEVLCGEILSVRAGEKIPLDGVLLEGETAVDTSALTGESIPVSKKEGDLLLSGSVNLSGRIRMEVTKTHEHSTVQKILDLVETAASKKAKAERFITRFARWYTPLVVVLAVLLAVVPPLFLGNFGEWIHRALIFLVVSCPCALVISVPLSFFGGIGGASRKGILMKGAQYLEMLSEAKTVVFDKTGTLTMGSFEVTELHPFDCSEEELLRLCALAESCSNHPIAQSVVRAYGKEIDSSCLQKSEEMAGMGICAEGKDGTLLVGNLSLMKEAGIEVSPDPSAGTVVYVAKNGKFCGFLVIADQMKPLAKEALNQLKKAGIERMVLLTGDRFEAAESVAKSVGLTEFHAGLLPHQKVEEVEKLLQEKKQGSLLFVGDGINDAPVLTRADVGIAMGALGSDAAIEAADVVLMDDQLMKLSTAVLIAKKTMQLVRQNILFALSVKGLVLLLGALGLAGMWLAVFADVGVMVLAILNAMRALKF